ncbi:MAG: tyrosine recombinase [Acidimicrobiaceae bacterium]|nr:tyrosine recombinase [Acidimicrobiaceae bacterium]
MDDDGRVREYLQWLAVERGRSRATLEAYRRDVSQFRQWWQRPLDEVRPESLEEFAVVLRDSRAPSSVARTLSSLRGFFTFLRDENLLSRNPAERLHAPARGRSLPKPLSEAEITRLIESVVPLDRAGRRDRALLELLYGTGVRVSEATGITLSDLDFDEDLLRVTGKGSKQRLVPMSSVVRAAVLTYLAPAGRASFPGSERHQRLFVNQRGGPLSRQGVDLIIAHRALTAGVDRSRVSAHVFRHSCATHMLNHGADIRIVQELLGHASISTTQTYTAVALSTLSEAYDSAHPRARG